MFIKRLIFTTFSFLLLVSCGSSKSASEKRKQEKYNQVLSENGAADPEMIKVAENALEFIGTKYEYGGTGKDGVDCSGLIYTSFLKEEIPLPRTSRGMSLEGKRIDMEEVQTGDLLFFQTNKNKNVINHVGLVIEVLPRNISFIHATTSRGVIISNLSQDYWKQSFVMARRVR